MPEKGKIVTKDSVRFRHILSLSESHKGWQHSRDGQSCPLSVQDVTIDGGLRRNRTQPSRPFQPIPPCCKLAPQPTKELPEPKPSAHGRSETPPGQPGRGACHVDGSRRASRCTRSLYSRHMSVRLMPVPSQECVRRHGLIAALLAVRRHAEKADSGRSTADGRWREGHTWQRGRYPMVEPARLTGGSSVEVRVIP